MPFMKWTLNPYRGCTHGCHYCFARRYQTQLELNAGDDFASMIFVKTNFVEVLRRELDKPSWTKETIGFGTATDPYQPIEGHLQTLARRAEGATRCRQTRSASSPRDPMIVRDLDVLKDLSARTTCRVHISIPTVDEEAWEKLEPGISHPTQRLRAVRELVDAGIDCGVLMAPLVPGFSTQPSKIERTIKAIADSGARSVGAMVMHLEGGTRDHFMALLAREYPAAGRQVRTALCEQVRPEGLRPPCAGGGVADARAIRDRDSERRRQKAVQHCRDSGGSRHQRIDLHVLVQRVRAIANRPEAVECRHAERRCEVAVGTAAGAALLERDAELTPPPAAPA